VHCPWTTTRRLRFGFGFGFGFAVRACRLNTQEAFWYLTGHAYWHQHAPPEPYQPSVQQLNLYLCLIKHRATNSYEETGGGIHNLGLDRGEWPAARPGCFIPCERAHGTRWVEGWLDPIVGVDGVTDNKVPSSVAIILVTVLH
jgi:hypothetical protein